MNIIPDDDEPLTDETPDNQGDDGDTHSDDWGDTEPKES